MNLHVLTALPSDRQTDPPSFKSSTSSGVLRRSSSGLRATGDSLPGDEFVNTAGPPLGGGISIPIRRYFLRLLLIHVCQLENTKNNPGNMTNVDEILRNAWILNVFFTIKCPMLGISVLLNDFGAV